LTSRPSAEAVLASGHIDIALVSCMKNPLTPEAAKSMNDAMTSLGGGRKVGQAA